MGRERSPSSFSPRFFLSFSPPPFPLSSSTAHRLLATWTAAAKRHGVPNRGVVAWVRRKLGPDVTVLRVRTDGSLGCATPCVLCRRALIAFDLRVSCPPGASGGGWYCGRLCSPDAPAPTLTSGQRRLLGHASPPKEGSRRSVARRRNKVGGDRSGGGGGPGGGQGSSGHSFDHCPGSDGNGARDGGSDGSDFWRVNGGTGGRTGAAAAAAQNAARRRRRGVSVGDVSRGFVAVTGASVSASAAGRKGGDVRPASLRLGHRARGPAQPAARTWFEDSPGCSGAEERSGGGGASSSDGGGGGGGGGGTGGNSKHGNHRGGRRGRRNNKSAAEKDLPLPQRGAPPPPPLPPLPPGRRSRVTVEWGKGEGGAEGEGGERGLSPGTPPRRSGLLASTLSSSSSSSSSRFKQNDGRYSPSSPTPSSSGLYSVCPSRSSRR